MSKMYNELKESLEEAIEVVKGRKKPSRVFEYDLKTVKEVRKSLSMSQQEFADIICISKATLENWEQGRRKPTGPARALLKILSVTPKLALDALKTQHPKPKITVNS